MWPTPRLSRRRRTFPRCTGQRTWRRFVQYFEHIGSGIDVSQILAELAQYPELWNFHQERITEENAFAGTSDIWLRYRAKAELTSKEKYFEPHMAVFYPAWYLLPALHPVVYGLMAVCKAT